MADPEHIKWLEQGVASWNGRRQSNAFKPDLGAALLQAADLEGADLSYADLANANLERANLKGANLKRSRLPGAYLHYADLEGAELESANLDGAELMGANLSGAHLKFASLIRCSLIYTDLTNVDFFAAALMQADLRSSNLTDADLSHAHVFNTDLADTEPWKAVLFRPESITPEQYLIPQEAIKAVEVLLSEIRKLRDHHKEAVLYFRGESENGWTLQPSVMREGHVASEAAMLVELTSRRPEEFSGKNSALSQWVLAQHHGLRTRFLDLTRNPLVALFHGCIKTGQAAGDGRLHVFAVPKELVKTFNSDTISIIANFAKLSRHQQQALLGWPECSCHIPGWRFHPREHAMAVQLLHQLIRAEKPYFDERINPRDFYKVFVVEPQQSSERIRAQSGCFLASAFHERFERDYIQRWSKDIPVYAHYRLDIPGESKPDILEDLKILNVTEETLYPGIDAAARAVTDAYGTKSTDMG